MITLKNGRDVLFQWDIGQRILLTDETLPHEVHFRNTNSTKALVVLIQGNEAPIPNILLQEPYPIEVLLYYEDLDESYTIKRKTFTVIPRPQPEDYVYTETEVLNYETVLNIAQSVRDDISAHNASATAHANQIAPLITNHNWLYDGRDLSTIFTVEQLIAAVRAADWTNIRIGDYWPITLNGTFRDRGYYTCPTSTNYYSDTGLTSLVGQTSTAYLATYVDSTYCSITISGTTYYVSTAACTAYYERTLSNAVFKMEVAGIDSYYQYGDPPVPHHIDFISRDCMGVDLLYNTTDTNNGAFIGSALFTTLNDSANGLVNLLPADLAAVIIQKRGFTEAKTGASASSWAWNDMGKLWLPTEQEVWGHVTWAEHGYGGGLSVHYPIFKDSLHHIIKGAGNGGGRYDWWCASSAAGSDARFCFVSHCGLPSITSAISANMFVPLCSRIA